MYPKELNTLGDHIRAKRLDLGLLQREVAGIIGVTTDTITNWEKNRNKPMNWHSLKINKFLGYSPFEQRHNGSVEKVCPSMAALVLSCLDSLLSRYHVNFTHTHDRSLAEGNYQVSCIHLKKKG